MNYDPTDSNHSTGFIWTKDNWVINKKITDKQLKIDVEQSDTFVKQHIYFENSGFQVERNFKLVKNKWYLFYYSYVSL